MAATMLQYLYPYLGIFARLRYGFNQSIQIKTVMKKNEFFRVGTRIYWKTQIPNLHGGLDYQLLKWNYECAKRDLGEHAAENLKVYKRFVCIPAHYNYQQVVNNCYNQYHEISSKPEYGDCHLTIMFLKHIFGEQYDLGLDYIKLLYEQPRQILPILCLVSSERETGKSTFLKWLKLIFESNAVYLEDESFTAIHNSDWVQKLIIGVDEVKFSSRQEIDKLKRLSTADKFMSRAMFSDKQEIDFFGKFILCSNYETDFIPIDQEEIRFWVRKIDSFKDSPYQIDVEELAHELEDSYELIDLLRMEVPAFLHFLMNREFSVPKKSRMWFSSEDIWTEQLEIVKMYSRPNIEKDAVQVLYDGMIELGLDQIKFTAKDLHSMLNTIGGRYKLNSVKKVIVEVWKLKTKNSSYKQIFLTHSNIYSQAEISKPSGRFYTITKEYLENCYKDWLNVGS